jgi:hypothetical protein
MGGTKIEQQHCFSVSKVKFSSRSRLLSEGRALSKAVRSQVTVLALEPAAALAQKLALALALAPTEKERSKNR